MKITFRWAPGACRMLEYGPGREIPRELVPLVDGTAEAITVKLERAYVLRAWAEGHMMKLVSEQEGGN